MVDLEHCFNFNRDSSQMSTLKLALEGVEKERDFYFSKLREVEVLCQEQGEENAPFVDRLMEVLYSADEQVSLTLHSHLHSWHLADAFIQSVSFVRRRNNIPLSVK